MEAPVEKGDVAGKIVYKLDGEIIGCMRVLFEESVERANLMFYLKKAGEEFLLES